jgi:hypothetical protein
VFALSGYVNPERTALRETAMAMGARYSPNWDQRCTHLCAHFGNTPKIQEAEQDGKTVVHGSWITGCKKANRRLDEQDFPVGGGGNQAQSMSSAKRPRNPPPASARRTVQASSDEESEASFTDSDPDFSASGSDDSPKRKKAKSKAVGKPAASGSVATASPGSDRGKGDTQGGVQDTGAASGANDVDEQAARVDRWLIGDLEKFEAFLVNEVCGNDDTIDHKDVARKGIMEAFAAAREMWTASSSFDEFVEQWEGPVPAGLQTAIDLHREGEPPKGVLVVLQRQEAAYKAAVARLPPLP